jgi:hypothetical protein
VAPLAEKTGYAFMPEAGTGQGIRVASRLYMGYALAGSLDMGCVLTG